MLPACDSEFHLIIYLGSLLAFLVGLGQPVRGSSQEKGDP